MNLNEMSVEELVAKDAELRKAIQDSEDIEELRSFDADLKAIVEELERRKAEEAEKAEIRAAVANGAGVVTEEITPEARAEEKTMEEVRSSKAYIDAYAEYIKSENDTECRALLTENVSGSVPVPTFVEDLVRTAWEREGITSRVRKSYLKGNLKVGFEISGDPAVIHTEGAAAIDPENLVLGVVTLVPQSIKKVIQISDEAYDLRGEAFLRYIYDELTYRIAKLAADTLVADILACGTVSTTTVPGVPEITATTASIGTVAAAIANLSDEAANPVIIMNKLTWGTFKAAQYAANYAIDPFEGLDVVFNDSITAFDAATTGVAYMIVGDLEQGALMNFPNGEEITFKFDELSLKKQDLIEVLGRMYVGIGVVAPNAFVKVTK